MPVKPDLSFVDLFAGCGGLSLGLEEAGFSPVFVSELSPDAMSTYLHNRDRNHPILREKYNNQDIRGLTKNRGGPLRDAIRGIEQDFGLSVNRNDIDLVVGGPPCQGFSGIGHRRSYAVDKKRLPSNHLYREMIQVIQQFQPKMFLFENVKGLLSARWTKNPKSKLIWEDVLSDFKSIDGYAAVPTLIQAKQYGVPQNRPRLFIVGVREELLSNEMRSLAMAGSGDAIDVGLFPNQSETPAPDLVDVLGDLQDDEYYNGLGATRFYPVPARTKLQRRYRREPDSDDVRRKKSPVEGHKYSKHSDRVIERFKLMQSGGGQLPTELRTKKFSQRVLPERWDDTGPSITVTSLPDDYVHYAQPRILTVREWARLQTFPDWYEFKGKRTTGGIRRAGNPREGIHEREVPQYTQIGNAVPVELARHVGEHFVSILGRS